MKRKLIILFTTTILSLPVFAQLEVKQDSFKEVSGFVNINLDKMYDDNDKPYSVIKVKTENISDKERRELLFQGDARTFFELEYKVGEVWIYISYYATYLKISHPDFGSTEFWFPFDMQGKKGYELTLINKPSVDEDIIRRIENLENTGIVTTSDQVGYITVKSSPRGAEVFIDNIKVGFTPYLAEELNVGNHKVLVNLYGYEPDAKRVNIELGVEQIVEFDLVKQTDTLAVTNAPSYIINNVTSSCKGAFSVSPNNMVYFSKGNLQYQASTNTWRFAENQWDYIGDATEGNVYVDGVKSNNNNISSTYDGWIDLFGWGTGDNPTNTANKNTFYSSFTDWGNNSIINGDNKQWRTLTQREWEYVFNKRATDSDIRYAKATVNGVQGIILFPDDWNASYYKLNNTNSPDTSFIYNRITKNDWLYTFEPNGAVFLPASGYRNGKSIGDFGACWYWSATENKRTAAYCINCWDSFLQPTRIDDRADGRSVRLVCPADD